MYQNSKLSSLEFLRVFSFFNHRCCSTLSFRHLTLKVSKWWQIRSWEARQNGKTVNWTSWNSEVGFSLQIIFPVMEWQKLMWNYWPVRVSALPWPHWKGNGKHFTGIFSRNMKPKLHKNVRSCLQPTSESLQDFHHDVPLPEKSPELSIAPRSTLILPDEARLIPIQTGFLAQLPWLY